MHTSHSSHLSLFVILLFILATTAQTPTEAQPVAITDWAVMDANLMIPRDEITPSLGPDLSSQDELIGSLSRGEFVNPIGDSPFVLRVKFYPSEYTNQLVNFDLLIDDVEDGVPDPFGNPQNNVVVNTTIVSQNIHASPGSSLIYDLVIDPNGPYWYWLLGGYYPSRRVGMFVRHDGVTYSNSGWVFRFERRGHLAVYNQPGSGLSTQYTKFSGTSLDNNFESTLQGWVEQDHPFFFPNSVNYLYNNFRIGMQGTSSDPTAPAVGSWTATVPHVVDSPPYLLQPQFVYYSSYTGRTSTTTSPANGYGEVPDVAFVQSANSSQLMSTLTATSNANNSSGANFDGRIFSVFTTLPIGNPVSELELHQEFWFPGVNPTKDNRRIVSLDQTQGHRLNLNALFAFSNAEKLTAQPLTDWYTSSSHSPHTSASISQPHSGVLLGSVAPPASPETIHVASTQSPTIDIAGHPSNSMYIARFRVRSTACTSALNAPILRLGMAHLRTAGVVEVTATQEFSGLYAPRDGFDSPNYFYVILQPSRTSPSTMPNQSQLHLTAEYLQYEDQDSAEYLVDRVDVWRVTPNTNIFSGFRSH